MNDASVSPELCMQDNIVTDDSLFDDDTSSKSWATPLQQAQHMIDNHNVSHLPFKEFVSSLACARGRAKRTPYHTVSLEDNATECIVVICFDYGFFGTIDDTSEEKKHVLPVLVGFGRKSKAIFSYPVPSKEFKILIQEKS